MPADGTVTGDREKSEFSAEAVSPQAQHVSPWRRIRLTKPGKLGLAVLTFWVVIAIFGPMLSPYSESEMLASGSFAPPSWAHWLGTDYIGRDVLSRILHGARVTLGLSFLATLLAFLVGVFFGFLAAISGPLVDTVISRINDGFISMPSIMLALVVIAALGSSIPVLIVTVGLIYATGVFRVSRALAMDVKVMDFVEVARARGEGWFWVIRREVLPNVVIPLTSEFGLRLVFTLLFVSGLSFLGLGVQPPTADWGVMVRENLSGMVYGSMAALVPALAIALLSISINLTVDDISTLYGRDITETLD